MAIQIHSAVGNKVTPLTGSKAVRKYDGLPPGQKARWVSSRCFQLEYDVDSVGPSGIAQVELWGTRDGGQSWASFGHDEDKKSPFPVVVDEEGMYGFCIAVRSGAGLGGDRPKAGDPAQVWIGVDWTKPIGRILSAELTNGDDVGKVLVRWEAEDAMLAARPVTLLYSEHRDGPWTTIAAELENTGQYQWTIDGKVPMLVYLRLEVRDEAGNLGIFRNRRASDARSPPAERSYP